MYGKKGKATSELQRYRMHVKAGDTVQIITGKEKGKVGQILKTYPKVSKVIVKGVNIRTKHVKPLPGSSEPGGIVKEEAPVHVSNVSLIDPKDGKPTRVRSEVRDGRKVRVGVRSGEII